MEIAMKGLLLYVGFVIAWTAAGVLIASYIDRVTSHQIGSIVLLAMFFSGLVVSWIATVFVMDGSLNNFFAEREQLEAERIGKLYMNRTNAKD
jgi:RsiW-degrading membrane proteinase PrsW (M82 family)